MTTKAKLSAREVQDMVKRYVEKSQPREFKLVVLEGAVMHVTAGLNEDDEHWYVVVRHEPELPRLLQRYSDLVTKIEDQIQKKEGVSVTLQSVLPPY